ncbi:MAG: hypothetical protein V4478_02455 [Patescibacteria group bacterium]
MDPLTWTTLEFEPRERHRDWNWYAGLIAVIVAILSFFYGNIFFGIFAIVAGATVIIYALLPPKELVINIRTEGVVVNDELIPSASITQFWLDETDKQDKLLLLIKGAFMPLMSLPLEGVTAEAVRAAMKPLAPEVEMHESRTIKIFDRLGF